MEHQKNQFKHVKLLVTMLQHNRAEYTLRTLKSLIKNTNVSFEVFIGDCMSDEADLELLKKGTKEIIEDHNKNYVAHSFMVKIIPMGNNESIGMNKNLLIDTATSQVTFDYILICDNDMEFSDEWFSKAMFMYENSKADLLGLWQHPHHNSVKSIDEYVHEMNNIPGNCWFTKYEIFEKNKGPLNEVSIEDSLNVMGEDTEFIFRMRHNGLKAFSVKENILEHFGKIRSDGKKAFDHDNIKI